MTIEDIKNLTIPDHFSMDDVDTFYNYLCAKYEDHIKYNYGATRFVLILNDCVVKIPFKGDYYEDGKYFKYEDDYNCYEQSFYKDAEAAGLEIFFASIKYGGTTFDGTDFYIYEKAKPFSNNFPSEDSMRKAREKSFDFDIDDYWLAKAYDYYDDEIVEDLLHFIIEEGINDLSPDNLGYRENGEPIIIDYAGYYEA